MVDRIRALFGGKSIFLGTCAKLDLFSLVKQFLNQFLQHQLRTAFKFLVIDEVFKIEKKLLNCKISRDMKFNVSVEPSNTCQNKRSKSQSYSKFDEFLNAQD